MKLFSFMGTEVRAHWSLIIPFIITSTSYKHFMMLLVCFMVVVAHEFGHILAGHLFGVNCPKVILSAIGGCAVLDKEPTTPFAEFVIALCGPLVNVFLVTVAVVVAPYVDREMWATFMVVNVFLLAFNLLPAFPMDGGRVLHSILWAMMPKLIATRICVIVSLGFASVGLWLAFTHLDAMLGVVSLFVALMALTCWSEDEQESIQHTVDEGSGSGRTASEQDRELLCANSHSDWHHGNLRREVA